MIFSRSQLCCIHRLVVLLRLVFVSLLLTGCGESNSTKGVAVKTGIGLGQAPDILSRAVDPAQLRPVVTMNGVLVSPELASDGSWFVDYLLFDSSLAIEMTWVENYNDQDLTLASWSGSFVNIAASSSFTIPVADYDTDGHDNDSDGMSNLDERIVDSDPNTPPIPVTDIRGVWIGPCGDSIAGDSFDFTQVSVNFAITSYQLSVESYVNPTGCTGTNYSSINIIGSYSLPDETTELDDGVAHHLDIVHTNGTITAGDDYVDYLSSLGISLQDFYTTSGIDNINDVSLEQLGVPDRIFTIYRIDGDQFFTGVDTDDRDGSSAVRRHNVLDFVENFTKN